jgi:hypothetical protein
LYLILDILTTFMIKFLFQETLSKK